MDAASGGSSVSLCMADAYPDDMYHMLRLACETQSPSRVVYELDPSYWMNEQRSGSTQIFFYQEFPASRSKFFYFLDKIINLDFRSALAPWSYYRNLIGQVPDHIRRKQSTSYKNYDPSVLEIPGGHYAGRGFIYRDRVAGEDKGTFNNIPWDESQVKSKAELYFNRIAAFCRKNGIELTVITTPVPQETLDKFAGSYDQSHLYFKKLLEGLGLEYYNFNYMKPGAYGPQYGRVLGLRRTVSRPRIHGRHSKPGPGQFSTDCFRNTAYSTSAAGHRKPLFFFSTLFRPG